MSMGMSNPYLHSFFAENNLLLQTVFGQRNTSPALTKSSILKLSNFLFFLFVMVDLYHMYAILYVASIISSHLSTRGAFEVVIVVVAFADLEGLALDQLLALHAILAPGDVALLLMLLISRGFRRALFPRRLAVHEHFRAPQINFEDFYSWTPLDMLCCPRSCLSLLLASS